METVNVGIDLHKTQFTICKMGEKGVIEEGIKYPMTDEGYMSFISSLQNFKSVRIAIESTGNARYFRDLMKDHGFDVKVVNTLRFKVVNQSTRKTDKNDARTLCEFLEKDMLPLSNLCSKENENLRRILKSRTMLVQNSVALKNQVHAILLAYGITSKPAQFQSEKKRKILLKTLKNPNLATTISVLFTTLKNTEKEIKALETHLRTITAKNRNVKLLMTIPGIGIVNACAICAYTDDINRFESYKQYSAYCGLVPWVQSSNQSAYYGHITKRGPLELRNAMVQCVVAMIRMPDKTGKFRLMKQYQYLKEQKSSGKAIIATARKLSRIIYIMLSRNIEFESAKLE